jgi:hypothetical protein
MLPPSGHKSQAVSPYLWQPQTASANLHGRTFIAWDCGTILSSNGQGQLLDVRAWNDLIEVTGFYDGGSVQLQDRVEQRKEVLMPYITHGADSGHAFYLWVHDVIDLQLTSNDVDDLGQIDMVELETHIGRSAGFFTGLLG